MQENEQKVDNKADNKAVLNKAFIGNAIMLFVLAIGIIIAVFAWFSMIRDNPHTDGISIYSNDDKDLRFNTYAGTVMSDGTVVYNQEVSTNDLNNEDFDATLAKNVVTLIPGEKKYFKTIISNYQSYKENGVLMDGNIRGSFNLTGLLVNKKLMTTKTKTCLTFSTTKVELMPSGEVLGSQQAYDLSTAFSARVDGSGNVDPTFNVIASQPVYKDITIPVGYDDSDNVVPGKGQVIIYWYVILNGKSVDNSVMGEPMMQFSGVKFVSAIEDDE